MSKNTPAVTRVEEWTRAETGVGAAIAAGNQLVKGICALFVEAANIKIIKSHLILGKFHILIIFHWPI